jgi:putative mRNA 3-end processing factor
MDIKFLGGAREVGRSAVCISDNDSKLMLDYGVNLQTDPISYPLVEKGINAVILSHAHLDHSGALPVLFKKEKPFLFTNDISLELTKLLIKDSIKIARKERMSLPFTRNHLRRMIRRTKLINYNELFRVGNFKCRLFDAGHIPGSAGVLLENDKRIFYTGDIKLYDTKLLRGCELPKKVDVLITESTYSYKDHPKDEEERFLKSIKEVIDKNQNAVLPVFAVGRAQEVLLILEGFTKHIALDGMAKKASDLILTYGYYLRDSKKLKEVLNNVNWIYTSDEREGAVKKYPLIVSTAGMLGGGPAISYIKKIKDSSNSKIIFTGFLVEDTPGRNLLLTGVYSNEGQSFEVKCKIEQYDLSSHAGKEELIKIIQRLKPKQVICVHGDRCEDFAETIEEKFSIPAYAPKNGETITI